MTIRFFFDLTDGLLTIHDEVGVLAADLGEAITQAWIVLEEMGSNDELSDSNEAWVMIIRDATGRALMTLPVVPRAPEAGTAS